MTSVKQDLALILKSRYEELLAKEAELEELHRNPTAVSELIRSFKKVPEVRDCVECDKPYQPVIAHQKYCSKHCQTKNHDRRRAERMKEARRAAHDYWWNRGPLNEAIHEIGTARGQKRAAERPPPLL